MKKVTLGAKRLEVSRLGLGCMGHTRTRSCWPVLSKDAGTKR